MAKLWSSILREHESALEEFIVYGVRSDGTYPALIASMPAQQHIGSAHRNRGLGTTAGLAREPDGVPHDVVGLSALFSVLFAAVILGMWLSGPTGRVTAVAMCMVGVPMLVSGLRKRAERERGER